MQIERENEAELGSGELLRIGDAKSHSVHREKNLCKQKLAHGSPAFFQRVAARQSESLGAAAGSCSCSLQLRHKHQHLTACTLGSL